MTTFETKFVIETYCQDDPKLVTSYTGCKTTVLTSHDTYHCIPNNAKVMTEMLVLF